jgi:hypothetical protein
LPQENGANVNAQGGAIFDGNGLQDASAGGYEAVVRLLLEKGANANRGYNAMQMALHA